MTLREVCNRANVSIATASRVLNGVESVRPENRQRVEQAMNELGFTPSFFARALAKNRSTILGVVMPCIGTGFFAELLEAIENQASRSGWSLLVNFTHGESDRRNLRKALQLVGQVSSMIFFNSRQSIPAPLIQQARRGMPVVTFGKTASEFMSVSVDNRRGGEIGMTHLIRQGCRHIGVLRGPAEGYEAQQRWEGCLRAAKRAKIPLDPSLCWDCGFREDIAAQHLAGWLDAGRALPDAFFCCNDAMALGLYQVLRQRGISVPGQVALVGFDNIAASRLIGLTTMSWPVRQAGQAAVQMAIADPEDQAFKRQRLFEPSLIVRESCGSLAPRYQDDAASRGAERP